MVKSRASFFLIFREVLLVFAVLEEQVRVLNLRFMKNNKSTTIVVTIVKDQNKKRF